MAARRLEAAALANELQAWHPFFFSSSTMKLGALQSIDVGESVSCPCKVVLLLHESPTLRTDQERENEKTRLSSNGRH